MAMNFSKTQIVDDPVVPNAGAGIGQWLHWDPLVPIKVYTVGAYTPPPSWTGCRFMVAGSKVGDNPVRGYSVIQVAAIEVALYPFVCNELARFPVVQDAIEHALVSLSAGTITKYKEDLIWKSSDTEPDPEPDYYLYYGWNETAQKWVWLERTLTETTIGVTGSVGIAVLVDVSGTIVPRMIGSATNTGSLTDGGPFDLASHAKSMRGRAVGNAIGFSWFLLPNTISLSEAEQGSESSLDKLLGTSSISIASGYHTGAASVEWIEYTGFGWSAGGVQFDGHTVMGPMPGPIPPRMD